MDIHYFILQYIKDLLKKRKNDKDYVRAFIRNILLK